MKRKFKSNADYKRKTGAKHVYHVVCAFKHKKGIFSGHAPVLGGSNAHDFGGGPDGLGTGENKKIEVV